MWPKEKQIGISLAPLKGKNRTGDPVHRVGRGEEKGEEKTVDGSQVGPKTSSEMRNALTLQPGETGGGLLPPLRPGSREEGLGEGGGRKT